MKKMIRGKNGRERENEGGRERKKERENEGGRQRERGRLLSDTQWPRTPYHQSPREERQREGWVRSNHFEAEQETE